MRLGQKRINPETASLTDLVDGRKAYTALWSLSMLQAFEDGLLLDVQELTMEELQTLLPIHEEPIFETPIEEIV